MCDRKRDLQSIASVCFGAVKSILTDILGISKVVKGFGKMSAANVDQ